MNGINGLMGTIRRGVKPKAVHKYDKAKQRRIKGCVGGSYMQKSPLTLAAKAQAAIVLKEL